MWFRNYDRQLTGICSVEYSIQEYFMPYFVLYSYSLQICIKIFVFLTSVRLLGYLSNSSHVLTAGNLTHGSVLPDWTQVVAAR